MENLKGLSISDLIKSKRIILYKVEKGDTFKTLSLKTSFSTHAENRLRVINNMFPSGEPIPGSFIKLVY